MRAKKSCPPAVVTDVDGGIAVSDKEVKDGKIVNVWFLR